MRFSRYIVATKIDGKGIFLFNCKTSKIYHLSQKYEQYFFNNRHKNIYDLPDSIQAKWTEWGILVEDNESEFEHVKNKFHKLVTSKERLRMTIVPTDACNFECIYCCQSEPYHTMQKSTQDNVLKFIQNVAQKYKSLYISWFGGEPLLAINQICEMSENLLDFAKTNKKPYMAEITTNGYLLNVQNFLKLINCRVRYYQITIDGTREIHNQNRPHKMFLDSYEKVYGNLLNIKKLSGIGNFRIVIRLNITPEMATKLDEITDQLLYDFGDDKRFIFAVQPVRDWGGDRIAKYKDSLVEKFDFYYKKMDLFNQKGLKLWDVNFFTFGNTFCDANYEHSFIINPMGELLRCSIAEYDSRYRDLNHVGKILDGGTAYMNKNDTLWREQIELKQCADCEVYPLCCRATCKLGFNISKCNDACKRDEMINYLQLFMKNKYARCEIDEDL